MKSCKIYEVAEPLAPEEVYDSLNGYSQLWEEELDGRNVTVGFRVAELERGEDSVWGVAEESWITTTEFRGEELRIPVSSTISFTFIYEKQREFLLVYASKRLADRLAVRFSELLFDAPDRILEVYLPPEKMREVYSKGEVRSMIIDNLRLPGIRKVTLFGEDLKNARTVKTYLTRGKGRELYVVYRDEEGVFGISRTGQIVAFSRIALEDFEAYIREKILPLAEPPPE